MLLAARRLPANARRTRPDHRTPLRNNAAGILRASAPRGARTSAGRSRGTAPASVAAKLHTPRQPYRSGRSPAPRLRQAVEQRRRHPGVHATVTGIGRSGEGDRGRSAIAGPSAPQNASAVHLLLHRLGAVRGLGGLQLRDEGPQAVPDREEGSYPMAARVREMSAIAAWMSPTRKRPEGSTTGLASEGASQLRPRDAVSGTPVAGAHVEGPLPAGTAAQERADVRRRRRRRRARSRAPACPPRRAPGASPASSRRAKVMIRPVYGLSRDWRGP